MASRPAFLTDNQIRGPVIHALKRWADVYRAVDLFGEKNDDNEIFTHAVAQGWIMLTADQDFHAIAHQWLDRGDMSFRLLFCRMSLCDEMTDGEMAAGIEAIVNGPEPFAYPIEYLKKPKR